MATMTYGELIDRISAGDFDQSGEEERAEATRQLIQFCSVAAGAIAFQPIPFMDVLLISPIQVAMVQGIGRIHGYPLDRKAILEILSSFGASIVAQNVVLAAVKFIPFAGWIAGVAMAYALTWAVGEVADEYFKRGRGMEPEEMRAVFRRVYGEKKAEKMKEHKGNQTLKERLEQLNEARAAGLIDDDEFEAKKQAILGDF